ncbi:MAG: TlpA family protein disulfide reductase [Verrucomicrobiales bacterium]|nr:TlpA family protein disulfide reductase [Verrucomicrobiales bacterium]
MRVPATAKISVNATANTWAFDEMKGEGSPHGDPSALSALIGKEAPNIELVQLDGEPFKLSDHLGKGVIILDFWATSCRPCIEAMPEVIAAVASFEDHPVKLIAVNQQESTSKVKKFLGANGWDDLPVIMDAELKACEAYQVTGIPTTVIIGKSGKVHMVHTGYREGLEMDLKEDINAALAE